MEDQIINQCKDFGFCTYSDGKPTEEIEQRSQTHPMTTAIVLWIELNCERRAKNYKNYCNQDVSCTFTCLVAVEMWKVVRL